MKQFILFVVIASLLALNNGAAVQSSDPVVTVVTADGVSNDGRVYQVSAPPAELQRLVSGRRILTVGTITFGDREIHGNFFEFNGIGLIYMDVQYRGSIPISAIYVTEIANNPHTTATIVEGGIGQVNATIRLSAPEGSGLLVRISIWGQ